MPNSQELQNFWSWAKNIVTLAFHDASSPEHGKYRDRKLKGYDKYLPSFLEKKKKKRQLDV